MTPDDLSGVMAVLFILFAIAGVLVSLLIYLTPAIIAFYRDHDGKWVILILTILAGWTFLAWIALFVWAIWPADRAPPLPFIAAQDDHLSRGLPEKRGLSPEAHLAAINRLQDMHDRGLLTRDEFRAHMNALLDPVTAPL